MLTASPADGVLFDVAFQMFFGNPAAFSRLSELQALGLRSLGEVKPPPGALRLLRAMDSAPKLVAAPAVTHAVTGTGYSPQESLSTRDFAQMTPDEQDQAARVAAPRRALPEASGEALQGGGPRPQD